MSGYIWVSNLWSHNGNAHVRPDHWAELVKATPVVPDRLFPYPLTPEVVKQAYLDAMECPALSMDKCLPGYTPTYDPMVIDPAIMGVPSCR